MAAADVVNRRFADHHIRTPNMRPHLQPADSDKVLEKLRDPRLTELKLTEEDLGIFEDNTICADLSDTDGEEEEVEESNKTGSHHSNQHYHYSNQNDVEMDRVSQGTKISYPDFTSGLGRHTKPSVVNGNETQFMPSPNPSLSKLPGQDKRSPSLYKPVPPSYAPDQISHVSGVRGKNNTPVSYFTEASGRKLLSRGKIPANSIHNSPHPPTSRRHSNGQGGDNKAAPLVSVDNPPFGSTKPQVFYIKQMKPAPMPDLKAWRGYNGNVYFEPIHVNSAQFNEPDQPASPVERCTSEQMQKILGKRHRKVRQSAVSVVSEKGDDTRHRKNGHGNTTMNPKNQKVPTKPNPRLEKLTHRQMAVLDKDTVINKNNVHLQEDLTWIVGQESTGSLKFKEGLSQVKALQQRSHRHASHKPSENQNKPHPPEKDKVMKGSVAHNVYAMKNRRQPLLSVHGDNFTPHAPMSPLLRTQTQYSLSNQRMTMNSPDLYHSFSSYDKLPPLEQLRASLRQIDSAKQDQTTVHMIPPIERMKFEDPENTRSKPFVKYAPELRAGKRL